MSHTGTRDQECQAVFHSATETEAAKTDCMTHNSDEMIVVTATWG